MIATCGGAWLILAAGAGLGLFWICVAIADRLVARLQTRKLPADVGRLEEEPEWASGPDPSIRSSSVSQQRTGEAKHQHEPSRKASGRLK
jgi:hypothetical protein